MIEVKLTRLEKIAAIVKDHEADCFDSLVAEYAEMGFSRYAIARRLLGIDVRTMMNNLSRPVVFQKAGHHEWHDRVANAAAIRTSRIANGNCRMITIEGETKHLAEWARCMGVCERTVIRRSQTVLL